MAQAPNIRRNIAQSSDNIFVNRWWTGEITQRSPLYTPVSALGLQMIARHDALYTGSHDMEISPIMTLVRRYGHSKFCTQQFGSSDWPQNYSSFKNTSGTIKLLVDTPTQVASFNGSTLSLLYTKGVTTTTRFQKVGSTVYMCDGTNRKKWDQTTVSNWGIVAPATAPTVSTVGGSLSPTAGYQWVYCYKNSSSGHYSTASPASGNLGPQSSVNFSVGYTASADAQVDTISIFRTLDGGSLYYWVADVANASATYTDSSADTALNTDIIAPISHSNDAPPAGLSNVTWHQDRLVGTVNNLLYFSAGPDCITGVPEESWPPANVFKTADTITGLASMPGGLLIWTAADMYVMLGTDTATFWVKPLKRNFGVMRQECVAQDGDVLFIYTSKAQLFQLDGDGENEIGFNVGDQLLTNFSPNSSYLAVHRSGTDAALWISNGSTLLKGYSLRTNAWYPTGTINGGIGAIKSIETSTGSWNLLVGRATGSSYILKRDTSLYTDDGTSYTCAGVVGSLIVAPSGDASKIEKVLIDTMPVGTPPTVGVLTNEISGTFTTLPNPVSDPPEFSGTPFSSVSLLSNRHYFAAAQSQLPTLVQDMQIKISFPAENFRAEVVALGIG